MGNGQNYCKGFKCLDCLRLTISILFLIIGTLGLIEQIGIPTKEKVRKIAFVVLVLTSGFLFVGLIVSERFTGSGKSGKYGDMSQKNVILTVVLVLSALAMLASTAVIIVNLIGLKMPDVSEELKKCNQIENEDSRTDCLNQFSQDDIFRVCEVIFENNHKLTESMRHSRGNYWKAHTYELEDAKYCVRRQEYNYQIIIAIISIITLMLFGILQSRILYLMKEARQEQSRLIEIKSQMERLGM